MRIFKKPFCQTFLKSVLIFLVLLQLSAGYSQEIIENHTPIYDALKLFDLTIEEFDLETGQPSSELIQALNQRQNVDWDMDTWKSSVYKAADSLQNLGLIGQMDKRIFKAADLLNQSDHLLITSLILLENGKYNEAAFLYYVSLGKGTGESRFYKNWNFLVPLIMINTYLETDISNYIHVREAARDYCKSHDFNNKSIEKLEDLGYLLSLEALNRIRIRQTPNYEALKLLNIEMPSNTGHFINYYNGGFEMSLRSPLLYKQIYSGIVYKAIDSLQSLGRVGQMDDSVFNSARYIDQNDVYSYLTTSMILGENAKYNEAAFMMNLGWMRIACQKSITNTRDQMGNRDLNDRQIKDSAEIFYRMIELYLEADLDNYAHVLEAVLDYFKNNDYPAFPRSENIVKYNKQIAEMEVKIGLLKTNRTKISEDWNRQKIYWKRELEPVQVKNESVIGSWFGRREISNTEQLVKFVVFEKDGAAIFPEVLEDSYDDRNQPVYGDKLVTYEIDRTTNPFHVKMHYLEPSTQEQLTEYYIAKFLDENTLQFGTPFSNNPIKFIPSRAHILTRDTAGEKAFFDYEKPKRTATVDKITDLELKGFWNDNIQSIIDLDRNKIMKQTIFPLQIGVEITDVERFQEYGLDQIFLYQKELRTALKDMDYKVIDQVQLDNEETGLMVYILGKAYYTLTLESRERKTDEPWELSQSKNHSCFGLLFRKDEGSWKLYSTSRISDDGSSDGSAEDIKLRQDELIHNAIVSMSKQSIESRNIQAIKGMDKNAILNQTNFPLLGNWGTAVGLKGEPSNWKKQDLKLNLDKFFSEEARSEIGYYGEDDSYGTKPITFEYYASYSTQIDEEWHQYISRMKFGKIGKEWKMISLVWEESE